MKKAISILLVMLISFCIPISVILSVDAEGPGISASAYVLYCADSGEIIDSRNEHARLGIASTTKIMTTLLCLEEAAACDREVKFTEEMIAEGSSMYLKVGDVVRLSDLAKGMMMVSGNDAANAAAIAVGGDYGDFAELMNRRAEQIGMKDTHFVTPSGLDHADHYSSAYDMALLMAYAMENEDFKELTSKTSAEVEFVEPEGHRVTYSNHNRLLKMYEDCIGGKTGYTISTGRCLVSCAERDGMRLIAVTLNDRNDWDDHISLYEYGFSQFTALTLSEDVTYSLRVAGGDAEIIKAHAPMTKNTIVRKADVDRVQCKAYISPLTFAPIGKGECVGKVIYSIDSTVILESELIADHEVTAVEESWIVRFFRSIFG